MDYESLKKEIKELANIASGVPEPFKQKCFELLLARFLSEIDRPEEPKGPKKLEVNEDLGDKLPIRTQMRVFMKKTKIEENDLNKVLMFSENEVHFLREPKDVSIAKGQRQWALLLSLKNSLLNDNFSVDPEDLRSICQEKGFYDRTNFATNMKQNDFSKLFKRPLKPQGESQVLSNEGQDELATLIKLLSGKTE